MFIKLQWVEKNSCICVHTDWPRHLIKDTWSCLTGLNRYLKCVRTRQGIYMSMWCVLTLKCWSALQRVAFLSDYSLTHDPPHKLPIPLVTAGTAELQALLKPDPGISGPSGFHAQAVNKQTRGEKNLKQFCCLRVCLPSNWRTIVVLTSSGAKICTQN